MGKEKLEKRMYGLVPYNISPIQQGIQYGHGVVQLLLKNVVTPLLNQEDMTTEIKDILDWMVHWKTFIILNGGTTNKRKQNNKFVGSLNNHEIKLRELGVNVVTFKEEDLGDQLTAVVFLLDERIFNKSKYPGLKTIIRDGVTIYPEDQEGWDDYLESIGGIKNHRIREYLSQFKLA